MAGYKVTAGVPLPPPVGRGKRVYPFFEMEVGDSTLIDGKTSASVRPSLQWCTHKTGAVFTTRQEPEGVRVWRTA